jgi:uncharacterized phage protein gp47/JayE
MALLPTKGFTDLVRDQAAIVQGSAAASGVALDFSEGTVLRALAEGNAALGLWLQALLLRVLSLTRAATSTGADLDSWVADFGVTRNAAGFAVGAVTLSRYSTGAAALILPGVQVRSSDGAFTYLVTTDTANAAWSATLGGYSLLAAGASVSVPVLATVGGIAGNALAGTVTLLSSAIPGIDTVTNPIAFTGGADAESDAALRVRFVAYLASLTRATLGAIGYAISQVQAGLTYTIVEQANPDGSVNLGSFYVVVDDGTGAPSGALLVLVGSAVEAYRPIGISFSVIAPTLVTANIAMTITTAAGASHPTEVAIVAAALRAYINGLALGADMPFTKLASVAYGASANVISVTGVTLNSGTADLVTTQRQVIRAGTVAVA